jgi:hypothetical protein
MNHGNRRAPVALAGDAPVFDAIGDGLVAEAFCARGERGHFLRASALARPDHSPEFSTMPYSPNGSVMFRPMDAVDGTDHGADGMPYFVQNSKSRSSCAGTAMMAPVP